MSIGNPGTTFHHGRGRGKHRPREVMGSRGEDADRRKRGKCGRGTGEVDWIIGERRVRKVSRETTALGAELEKRKYLINTGRLQGQCRRRQRSIHTCL